MTSTTSPIKENTTVIELSMEQAFLFTQFQMRYDVIAPLVGYMDSMKVFDLKNMSIQLDIDKNGVINHTSITRHFRPLN